MSATAIVAEILITGIIVNKKKWFPKSDLLMSPFITF
jgi:hypothetical protein